MGKKDKRKFKYEKGVYMGMEEEPELEIEKPIMEEEEMIPKRPTLRKVGRPKKSKVDIDKAIKILESYKVACNEADKWAGVAAKRKLEFNKYMGR